jgi:endonuclease III
MQGMFHFFDKEQTTDICFIRRTLLERFGPEPPRLRGSLEDQFFGSILGSRTHDNISKCAFTRLATRFDGDWNVAAQASESEICSLIKDVTFPEKKAAYLKLVWQNNRVRNGTISFDYLTQMSVDEALRELEKNFGVGRKTSAAALNFSVAHGRAFVVDTHVVRILRRFGFIGLRTQTEHVYGAVMHAATGMDADDLFELHWHLKRLGQEICAYSQAACGCCPLSTHCLHRLEPGTSIVPNVQSQSLGHGFP